MRRKQLPLFLILLMFVASACTPEAGDTADEGAGPSATATMSTEDGSTATIISSPTLAQATTTPLPSETPTPEPTLEASGTSSLETVTPPPSPTSEPAAAQVISGQTAQGAFFLGAPAAPLTVIDYSDFL